VRELGLAICAADVVATVYLGHPYTASMLITAAAAEKPVVGSNEGWIGRSIKQFELGHTCDPADPASVADAVVAALDNSADYQLTPAARRFVEYSGEANFAAHWTARLRERLGWGPSPELRSWGWVTAAERAQAA
jgi:glycosyltransferase involved in cell wall biosynthesis